MFSAYLAGPAPNTAVPAASQRAKASQTTPNEPRVTVPEPPTAVPAPEQPALPRTRSERRGVIEPLPPAASSSPVTASPSPAIGGALTGERAKLRLEVVSYAETPAQRLVFISGRKYVEGDTIDGGFRVEQIREDSVVLSERGERFTLR